MAENRKKILIFSLVYYPNPIGGAEVAIKEITDRIDPKDIEFHMVTLRFDSNLPKIEKIGNVGVHRVGGNKLSFPFLAFLKARQLHKKNKYDAIWAMMAAYAGFAALFFKLTHPKVPYLLTLQEGDPIDYIKKKVRFVYPLFRMIFTKADVIQVISNFLGDWARRMGFNGPIEFIPNGFSKESFFDKYSVEEVEELKKKFGKKKDDVYLVTVSRLVHKNAVDDVIRAMQFLPANIYFIVVGGGPDEEMLKNLAKDFGVAKRVKFIGQVDRTETAKYRKISDIFIRPSRSEGMGNSFISTMVAKLPIITTQEGGIADFLFDARRNPDKPTTGWAVDKDSPEQIAEAVKDILTHPEQVKKVVENAYNLAVRDYNWDFIAKDMRKKVFSKAWE
ncbi:MAG: glycosyltransferase family 4 protein [Candidatus Terrybacteria bacterium]|nr:glycosyltransferase family 4 protein [Candidatus Terrybacteria bacterium]